MGKIQILYDNKNDLTKFIIMGNISSNEVTYSIKKFYNGKNITKNVLWDLTLGKVENIKTPELDEIVALRKKYAHLRNGGKTAILAPEDLKFGMARMVELMTPIEEEVIETRVFKTMDEINSWFSIR